MEKNLRNCIINNNSNKNAFTQYFILLLINVNQNPNSDTN